MSSPNTKKNKKTCVVSSWQSNTYVIMKKKLKKR